MKKLMALLLAGLMLLSLGGCKAGGFDAKGYVQAVLDTKFHGEYKEYANIIGIKEEEAKEQMQSEFKQSLETLMAEFKESYGITEEEMTEYVQLEANARMKVQYTVGDAKKDKDGNYTVKVQIKPVKVYDEFESAFSEKLTAAIQSGATKDQYMGVLLNCMKECVENAENGEAVTFTFHVTGKESDGNTVYSISEEEMLKVDSIATGQEK